MALSRQERERLIEQYAAGPARLAAAFAAVPDPVRQWRPSPADWSAHEVVCHCADSESNASLRIRYLVVERDPLIVGYDQDAWARVLDYHARPVETALVTVAAVRANTVPLLRALPEAAWDKEGRHTESGCYTAEDWLCIYAAHVHDHARQIEANVAPGRPGCSAPHQGTDPHVVPELPFGRQLHLSDQRPPQDLPARGRALGEEGSRHNQGPG